MSSSTTPSPPREGEAPLPYEDPRRPSFPYYNDEEGKIDLELTIRPHSPPLPFGSNVGAFRDKNIRTYCSDQKRMRHFTQSEWCLAYPLIETPPHQSHNSTRKLRVVDKIAAGENRGAQVLLCCLDEDKTKKYVAKIYDLLYYTFWDSGPNAHDDCTWMADDDYSREALVYQRLAEFSIDGKFTPKFYGCWTFERPLFKDPIVNSPVRLILIEYLPGVCMDWILKSERRTKEITPNHRLDIYAKILEIDTTLDFYGITHNDVSPRNIILVGSYKDNMPKIYFIDFNVAKIDKPLNSEAIAPEWRSIKPVSPRYHHWGEVYDEFVNWVPQPMGMSRIYFNGWLKKVWGDEHPEFSGPSVFKGENFDYESKYKYAEPEEDQIYYE